MTSSSRKKQRRYERHCRNREKDQQHKEGAWRSGKLIEENHNNSEYSSNYTIELCDRLVDILGDSLIYCQSINNNDLFLSKFRAYRIKVRDLILHWSSTVPKSDKYNFLKRVIEEYWDNPDNLIKNVSYDK
jgi:hypothetical protein